MKPLCFVIMPFGKKKDSDGKLIDFDVIYKKLLGPAIIAAGMDAIRADEETVNGIIHKPMYERLILCDYAIADLTTANANVFYELGVRHAVKPFSTVMIFAEGSTLPFDVKALRCQPYSYDKKKAKTKKSDIEALTKQLKRAKKQKTTDSPVYQLVDGISFQNSVAHQKTDVFRDQVEYNTKIKGQLEKMRGKEGSQEEKIAAIDEFVKKKIEIEDEEAGVLVDVMLSYRSIGSQEAYKKMIDFIGAMPLHVKNTVMVQEQLGFALNRIGERDEAIKVLQTVIDANGASSETYGIMGRVYKDKYDEAVKKEGDGPRVRGLLDRAIETYRKGFEADWRDAYPGINLLTLLEIRGDKAEIQQLASVVEFSVQRKLAARTPDYWDYATLMEIAVIADNEPKADENLARALACPIESSWMPGTTIKNMMLIVDGRKKRNESSALAEKMIKELQSYKTAT